MFIPITQEIETIIAIQETRKFFLQQNNQNNDVNPVQHPFSNNSKDQANTYKRNIFYTVRLAVAGSVGKRPDFLRE